MAKANLNDLIEWLKSDDKNRFEIYDLDKNESIQKCASYTDLSHNYVTPQGYFEALADNGVRAVQIVKKRKNGSTYVRDKGCGLNFGISTDANMNVVAASGLPDRPAATQQHQSQPAIAGLGSPTMGLGYPEIMAMKSQADRFEDLKIAIAKQELEKDKLLAKIASVEAENKTLERENLTFQLGKESKPSSVDKFVEALAANPASIPQIIQSFKGSPAPALNGPAQEGPRLSDIKSKVVDTIRNPGISDNHVAGAYYALVQYSSGNKEFTNQYEQLLINHNIIENGSNSDSDRV